MSGIDEDSCHLDAIVGFVGACVVLGNLIQLDHLGGYRVIPNIVDDRGSKIRLYTSSYY